MHKTFFTSDTHFNHANIIGYCRPKFKSLEEMNETIIAKWNSKVSNDDIVYHLGDFAMGPKDLHRQFGLALNGHKILVRGNHDRTKEHALACGFNSSFNSIQTRINGHRVFMRHLPPEELDGSNRPWLYKNLGPIPHWDYFLCGHVHEQWKRKENIINVGVDQWDFTPRTFEELIA